jgi:diguanylate cyclase (GGDEF)-like protein
MGQSVLLVDDERFARTVYSDYLRSAGYDVEVADGADSAAAMLTSRRFDVLLTDVILPGPKDGLELLGLAKQLDPNIGVIVITALDKVDPAVRAMKAGAADYLVKPVTPETLQLSVQRCLATRALLDENLSLRTHLKLFESGQRISSTLDRERLVPLALAAITSECGSVASALFERVAEGAWVPSGAHVLEHAETTELLAACRDAVEDLDAYGPAVTTVSLPTPIHGASHAACLTVTDEGTLVGAVAVLVAGPLPPYVAENAAFLCRHLGIALRTLGRLKQVEHLVYIDDLTHLYNTRYLHLALDRELASGRSFTVLFMDLDHFKAVNDQHGHLSGSRMLVEVARVLRSCVRDEDVVVRYGGDEYVVLLVGIDSGGALKVAERVRRAIEDHRFLSREGARVRITASIGLASFPEHAEEKAEIIELADRAMYRGKKSTRNVVYMASHDLPPVPVGERTGSAPVPGASGVGRGTGEPR